MAIAYVTLPGSPAVVSSAFALSGVKGGLAIMVPSMSPAVNVTVEFAMTENGPTFGSFRRDDGTGTAWSAFSGTGAAFVTVPKPPTPYGRMVVTSGQLDVRTFAIIPVAR
jgi:hypothetical protein